MKKFIVLAALLAAGVAQAGGYTSLEYYDEHNRATGADNIKEAIVVGMKEGAMDYSLKMENSQTEFGNGSISQGLEVRVKRTFDMFYLGGRLGEKVTSSANFSHYAIDAGVKIPLGAGFTGDVGARYRNAFETGHSYETTRGHVAVGYALTKQDSVAVRWSRSWGDEEKDAWRLQYTRSF
jgi:hypothetical protein